MAKWMQQPSSPAGSVPDHFQPSASELYAGNGKPVTRPAAAQPAAQETVLTHGMIVRGEIAGDDALYIDGVVEGEISVPGERVTVGPNGTVMSGSNAPCITAREIVVLGTVKGNIVAMDRVEIRANGRVTGDVNTVRIKIEDGSFLHGGISIREAAPQAAEEAEHEQMSPSDEDYATAAF